MFVLTVDQVGSRTHADRVDGALRTLRADRGSGVLLGPDRTVGDEFQAVVADPAVAFGIALDLLRDGDWSVGMGIGAVDTPLPASTREARGPAFVAARDAVERAKRAGHRFAITAAGADAADAEAVAELLLEVRGRRSPEGWAVADLLAGGGTQADAAATLGVTPQAVSLRAKAAALAVDRRAVPAIVRLLAALDAD